MLRDADPNSFSGIYVVCGFTDMWYGIDTLAFIIEERYHLSLFVPNTLLTPALSGKVPSQLNKSGCLSL